MKRNMLLKIGILLVSFVLVCSLINPVSAVELDIAVSSDPAIVNQILSVTVTRSADGSPVEGALVQYILNNGTPINTFTNASGISTFKPQLTGTLVINADYNFGELTGKRTGEVVEAISPDTSIPTGTGGGAQHTLTPSPTPTSVTPTPTPRVTPTPPAVTPTSSLLVASTSSPSSTPTPTPSASVPAIRWIIIAIITAVIIIISVPYLKA